MKTVVISFMYPKFNASYKVVGDLMIFYAGAEGN
jgi:hypothetical protein